jgi:tRNA G18 (ribose-2'-O)-methylase SpoU
LEAIPVPQFDITSLDDPLLEPFRELRSRKWVEQSGLFIAEGPLLVERLLASPYGVKSILLDRKYFDHYVQLVPAQVDLLVVEHELVESIVGFNFHRGVMGCGLRKPIAWLRDAFALSVDPAETIVWAAGVQDPENLGGILRSCAALGIERVIVGPGSADPLSRRVLRVSMGNALRLQLFRSRNLAEDLRWLSAERGIFSVATTLHPTAVALESATRAGPTVILIGNERYGLPEAIQAGADQRVTIAMDLGTDSLNVCVAAGIVMHYYCRIAR